MHAWLGCFECSVVHLPPVRCELESALEQLQSRDASINALELELANALKALKKEDLEEEKRVSSPDAADVVSARLDCLTTEREALITRKQALESELHKKDVELERIRGGISDTQVR